MELATPSKALAPIKKRGRPRLHADGRVGGKNYLDWRPKPVAEFLAWIRSPAPVLLLNTESV